MNGFVYMIQALVRNVGFRECRFEYVGNCQPKPYIGGVGFRAQGSGCNFGLALLLREIMA